MNKQSKNKLDLDYKKIIEARHEDPFSILGLHEKNNKTLIRVYMPHAESVTFGNNEAAMERIPGSDFFEYNPSRAEFGDHYLLNWVDKNGKEHQNYDPYNFGVQFPEFDQHLF